MTLIPTVIESHGKRERDYDIFSRLLSDRIIFLHGVIDDDLASSAIAQLLYLESIESKEDIFLYINSPGGVITSCMAIYDTMQYISCDVSTVCIGLAASMASFLLASGTMGKRFALPNSEIILHQPFGGVNGQASDIEISAKHLLRTKTVSGQ